MRISTKCSIALHVLLVLAVFQDEKLTSEVLAGSTGCNPVVIRNILGSLKKAGIVEIQRGTGGSSLCREPDGITIWDVFTAVEPAPLKELVGLHPDPSQKCPVGKSIYSLLEKPYGEIADSVRESMRGYTLQQLLDEYKAMQ